ncbi:MAG: ATPase MipZ, partial [Pseudomonadota bacterium]
MILTLAGQKGGTGKSTLAINLAVEWMRRGKRVLLVDA